MSLPRSDLPIVSFDPPKPKLKDSEKYGGLFYLGMLGLVVLVGLIATFGYGLWTTRALWRETYILHDPKRNETDRIFAAYALSRDPNVTQRQLWDMCLEKPLPGLARYLLAERLTSEAVEADPKAYVAAVAYSEGWTAWLRLLLLRPMAYTAEKGIAFSAAPLLALCENPDPIIRLWALYVRAASTEDEEAEQEIAREADGPRGVLAKLLLFSLHSKGAERRQSLDDATLWLRGNHPEAAPLWEGWQERGDQLVPRLAPPTDDPH